MKRFLHGLALWLLVAAAAPAQDLPPDLRRALEAFSEADLNDGPEVAAELLPRLDVLLKTLPDHEPRAHQVVERFLATLVRADPGEHRRALRRRALLALGQIARSRASGRLLLRLGRDDASRGASLALQAAIGALPPGDALSEILSKGVLHRDAAVRERVLRGLSRMRRPESRSLARASGTLILRGLTSPKPSLRAASAEAASGLRLETSIAPLLSLVHDADPLVRQAVARSLTSFATKDPVRTGLALLADDDHERVRELAFEALGHSGNLLDAGILVAAMTKEARRNRFAIARALRKLTGLDLGAEPGPWEGWWRATRRHIETSGGTPMRFVPGATSRYAAQWYGIPVESDRILFILDVSMSMRFGGNQDEPSRMERAKEELIRTLESLDAETRFGILAFSTGVGHFDRRGLVRADATTRARAARWVKSLTPAGGTDTYGALCAALRLSDEVDTLYFLSDGVPSRGLIKDPDHILDRLHAFNAVRRVRIHTVALLNWAPGMTDDAESENAAVAARFMEELAAQNDGRFVRIE
ncbi:MAG: HEAT repeat domain-containing protein [Planctomycetes bacterium]|nr:HEAT repeat domain-containing protein [Planctomycetota bacterium]